MSIKKRPLFKLFLSFALLFPTYFYFSDSTLANTESDYEYIPTATIDELELELESKARIPNAIPITITPDENGVSVKVNNIGVDALDSVSVAVTATGYSETKRKVASVPPLLGTEYNFSFPMIKTSMVYDVKITVVDGTQTRFLTGQGKLAFSEADLSEWNKGTYGTIGASVNYHFRTHGAEVSATNIPQYLRKASEYKNEVLADIKNKNLTKYNVTVGTGSIPSKKYKHKTDRRYIIITDSTPNKILSFGK